VTSNIAILGCCTILYSQILIRQYIRRGLMETRVTGSRKKERTKARKMIKRKE